MPRRQPKTISKNRDHIYVPTRAEQSKYKGPWDIQHSWSTDKKFKIPTLRMLDVLKDDMNKSINEIMSCFYKIAVQVNFCVLQLVYQHLYMCLMFLCCFFSSVCFVVFRCLFLICLVLFYYYSLNASLFYKNRQNDSGWERSWGRIQRSGEGKLYHNTYKKIYIYNERKIDMWWRFCVKKPLYYILK